MFANARKVGLALAISLGAAGCYATMGASTTETESMPSMVWIEGDIWVVEDYDEPVFYTDGYYWRQDGAVWYRSHRHDQGWVTVTSPPDPIRRIDRPTRYAHYVAPPEARRQGGPPAHAPAHGVRGTPPGQERRVAEPEPPPQQVQPPASYVAEPPPERGPPASVSAGPPPGRGPGESHAAEGKPDKGPDKGQNGKNGKNGKDKKPNKGKDKK